MTRRLCVSEKLLSLKERFHITDEAGRVLYECTWMFAGIKPRWKLWQAGREVAEFRKKYFTWAPTWRVTTIHGDFRLRRRLFSLRRRVIVEGGPHDGAELTGGLFGMTFRLTLRGETIAEGHRELISLRDRHHADLLKETPEAELLTALLLAHLLVTDSRD